MMFPDEQNEQGEFVRQEDQFRGRVTRDGSSGYPAEAGTKESQRRLILITSSDTTTSLIRISILPA